jgi:hypothetical protein
MYGTFDADFTGHTVEPIHPVFLYIQADDEAKLFESQLPTIIALTKGCKAANVIRDLKQIPSGCGGSVVTPTIAVHTLVRVSTFLMLCVGLFHIEAIYRALWTWIWKSQNAKRN